MITSSLLQSWLLCAIVVMACSTSLPAADRVTQDLLVLYELSESSGDVVHDTSGGNPINLQIDKPSAGKWRNGSLSITSSTTIRSTQSATRLSSALMSSNAVSLEAWIKPGNNTQKGPARIVSLSSDPGQRNFTLGQDGRKYDVRLRTTMTSTNGIPSVATPDAVVAGELQHLIYTRSAQGEVAIWVNGQRQVTQQIPGDLSNWSNDFPLLLANEASGDRPWLGELHLVAIYSRALTDQDVARNYAAGVRPAIDYAALLPPAAKRKIDFVADVQPILRTHCFECHSAGNEEGGLNLGVRARVFEGGDNGPVLKAGDSAESRLIHLVAAIDKDAVMPPEKDRLTAEQVGILRAWIDQGANWPAGADVLDPRTERARSHWAFQELESVELPNVKDSAWARTPIDRFLLAGLKAQRLQPTAPATPRTLIRRLSFDIVGLPPTPAEIEDFEQAASKELQSSADNLIDRLLASPHYGERWGRHWLDVARYADSDGQEGDRDRPEAYHYRDFVIRALNDDLPYDTFVRWQIAGDEYEPQNPDAVAATGFLVAGPNTVLEDTFLEEERLRNRYNELDDMVSTIGTGMLGLTLGCARCHDHKYDAVSAREYYRLLSAVHSGDRKVVKVDGNDILSFQDFRAQPATTWLFGRGDFYDRTHEVQLGFPAVLTRGTTVDDYWPAARQERREADSTFQRKALAEWLTDVEHGAGALVARVMVNRVWQHHFGEGLVRTVNDFGVRGSEPSNLALLNWLAHDFVTHGWKLKRLHKLILTSSVYQQACTFNEAKAQIDPENQLLWRMRPQRLEAEILRDTMLAAAGTLNLQTYGPAFKPPISSEAMIARNLKSPYPNDAKDSPETRRRSVYMFHKRVIPYPLLQAFDRPDSLQSCGRREDTTVAPQALALLNDGFVRQRALEFANRVLVEAGDDEAKPVTTAFQIACGRPPTNAEQSASVSFVRSQQERRLGRSPKMSPSETRRLAIADYCQTLFGLNEFLYVD